ncbi:YihY/virulence factor BrkB family protein [Psychromicrobium lacuslunae]|uniref:YihY/virulence factor BrkB family protein n=1 Tax=Psychromicrobium lacuslunae TaxID=1618207 RepID=UPI0005D34A18|nr:YihY/virulence factor BrkB family protein [Psychromicrobium lacuslunae]
MAVRKIPKAKQAAVLTPAPTDRKELERRLLLKRVELSKAKRKAPGAPNPLQARVEYYLAALNLFRPMRAFQTYSLRHGPLLAAGSAYNMFFSVAAMLVAGFSILGIVANGNRDLQNIVIDAVNKSTPGLIKMSDGESGLATPQDLFNAGSGFGWALVISLAALLLTSLGWIGGLREGVRGIFDSGPLMTNPILLKLKDAATLVVLGIVLVITSVISVGVVTALDSVIAALSLDPASVRPITYIASLLVLLLLDLAVCMALFRVVSAVTMPRGVLWQTALIAAVGSTVLRALSSLLLANVAGKNPLLAPFSVILGLFVWFYLLSQVYLIAAGWGAVGKADAEQGRTTQPA